MWRQFLDDIVSTLQRAGFTASRDDDEVIVSGCRYYTRRKHRTIEIAGVHCGERKDRTYSEYNVAKAMKAIIAALPQRLAAREQQLNREAMIETMRGVAKDVLGEDYPGDYKAIYNLGNGLHIQLANDSKRWQLSFLSDDIVRLKMLIDFVKEYV